MCDNAALDAALHSIGRRRHHGVVHAQYQMPGSSICMWCHWNSCQLWEETSQMPCRDGHRDARTASFLTKQVWVTHTIGMSSTTHRDCQSCYGPFSRQTSGKSLPPSRDAAIFFMLIRWSKIKTQLLKSVIRIIHSLFMLRRMCALCIA